MSRSLGFLAVSVLALPVVFSSCVDDPVSLTAVDADFGPSMSADGASPPPPDGLVPSGSIELWPWTGRDLSGATADPVNLLFVGDADVVSLRAALLALDGNRTAFGFPPASPFDCTWKDAHGEIQTTYSSGAGWVASAVQLECGDYAPVRFHVRLFDAGSAVIGAVHFDLLIPGTPQHQVLAWELPQQLVTVDFARSGLLAAPPAFQAVNAPGAVQAIPKPIYDGIPDALKVALGLPPGPAAGPGVGVPSDGVATILTIGAAAPVSADVVEYEVSAPFNQVIPRPFCAQGPTDFVLLQGPVEIAVRTQVSADGQLEVHNTLRGELDVTPMDISTGLPSGPTFRAQISQIDNAGAGPSGTRVDAVLQRKALPPGVGFLRDRLVTGPEGLARFTSSETCGAGG
jgi:hypothetical protein